MLHKQVEQKVKIQRRLLHVKIRKMTWRARSGKDQKLLEQEILSGLLLLGTSMVRSCVTSCML